MKKQKLKNILFDIGFALATFIVVLLFYENIALATILLLIIAIIGLLKWKSKRTLMIFLFAGVFGTIAEIIAVKVGIWDYQISNFYNIPLWLFIVWANAGAFIYQIAKEIREKRLK